MNATRATAVVTTDGAVSGTTTETPPEDPPPWDSNRNKPEESPGWLFVKFLLALAHVAIAVGHILNH